SSRESERWRGRRGGTPRSSGARSTTTSTSTRTASGPSRSRRHSSTPTTPRSSHESSSSSGPSPGARANVSPSSARTSTRVSATWRSALPPGTSRASSSASSARSRRHSGDADGARRPRVKITGVDAIPLAVPLRESTPPSPWAAATAKQILVRLTTDEGLTGWGECFAYGATLAVASVVEEALAPIVLGQDPTQIAELVDRMHRALMIWGRRGLAMMAVSGVELALWDLCGKARGVPVYQLLGGLCQSRARVYASLLRYETPTHVRQAVSAALVLGYTAIKLHQVDVDRKSTRLNSSHASTPYAVFC